MMHCTKQQRQHQQQQPQSHRHQQQVKHPNVHYVGQNHGDRYVDEGHNMNTITMTKTMMMIMLKSE